MTRDEIIAATKRMTLAINNGEYDILDEICDAHMVNHGATPHPDTERGEFRQYIEDLKRAFSGSHVDARACGCDRERHYRDIHDKWYASRQISGHRAYRKARASARDAGDAV
jgi:hypothetical protein